MSRRLLITLDKKYRTWILLSILCYDQLIMLKHTDRDLEADTVAVEADGGE